MVAHAVGGDFTQPDEIDSHGLRRGQIAAAVLAGLALGTAPASAAFLLNVRADRGARASLTFDDGVPNYRIYGNGSSDVVARAARHHARRERGSLDRQPRPCEEHDDRSTRRHIAVTFHTASSANITVTNGTGQSLLVSLRPSGADAGTDNFGVSPPSLMEVVPLKYP